MSGRPFQAENHSPALEAFLLGQVDFDRALALQQRLIVQCRDRDDGQIILLLCEHPAIITVGRGGSPGQLALQSDLLRRRQIEVRWVNRGGGCLVHCPGQLAIYPIVPLRWHDFSVGEYLERLQTGIVEALDDLNVHGQCQCTPHAPRRESRRTECAAHNQSATIGRGFVPHGVWGRTGQLAAIGAAVRHWVTYYGAYLNVCPPMGLFRLIQSHPTSAEKGIVPICAKHPVGRSGKRELSPFPPKMSCLVAERRGPVRMTAVRAALVRRLAECFGCDHYHLYTGHPLLRASSGSRVGDR